MGEERAGDGSFWSAGEVPLPAPVTDEECAFTSWGADRLADDCAR